jgi:hypothetical protein
VLINASNNLVGGTMPGAGNVIGGWRGIVFGDNAGNYGPNAYGANGVFTASGDVVQGNYIGLTASGSQLLSGSSNVHPQFGIFSGSVNDSTISSNVIAGWEYTDISSPAGALVEGNYIGTNSNGIAIPDPTCTGIAGGQDSVVTKNLVEGCGVGGIGGSGSSQITNNVIAFNDGPGVSGGQPGLQIEGNAIYDNQGPGVSVQQGSGVQIEGNSIYGNGQPGIVLGVGTRLGVGVNTNASNNQANHNGPNSLMNFPVLTSVQTSAAGTTIDGSLSTGTANGMPFLPNATITLDFYADSPSAVDPSGYGQGQTWLGSIPVTTDQYGNTSPFSADFSAASLALLGVPGGVLPAYDFVTATATDANGDTSEFSADIPVGPTSGGPYTITAGESATFDAAAGPGPGANAAGYIWLINGQQYGSLSNSAGYNPTLTWAQLSEPQSQGGFGITGPGTYSVEAEWYNSSGTVTPLLPATKLYVDPAPVPAAITTSLPTTDDSGNPTTTAGTPVTLSIPSSEATDPNTGTTPNYSWSVVEHQEPASLGSPSVQVSLVSASEYATRVIAASSGGNDALSASADSSLALGAPDGNGWSPAGNDGAAYLAVGFDTPMYADSVTISDSDLTLFQLSWRVGGGASCGRINFGC